MFDWIKAVLKKVLPRPIYRIVGVVGGRRDFKASASFIRNKNLNISLRDKLRILKQLYLVSLNVESPHAQEEILNYI